MHVDVSRAYFYAKALRDLYLQLPSEDRLPGEEDLCGKLVRAMYGARDAAQAWQKEYTQTLEELGFCRGKASPCHVVHHAWDVPVFVHGDDFVFSGSDDHLQKIKDHFAGKYSIKVQLMGGEAPEGAARA